MGFYIRKSVKCGPLRFNLSKSGIGVSAGIPGFRVGAGPRGTYVHMGKGGLYYRKTISSSSSASSQQQNPPGSNSPSTDKYSHTYGTMKEISSGSVSEMTDSNSESLLAEIKRKHKRIVFWPFALIASLILIGFMMGSEVSLWLSVPAMLICVTGTYFIYEYDQLKKSVVMMYELDGPMLTAYKEMYNAVNKLSSCVGLWHITASGSVYDSKYHAGASNLISRRRLVVKYRNPPYVKTNLSVPVLPMGKCSFYFLPDRMLVYASNGVGAVSYDDIRLNNKSTRFIEDGSVPRDAKVVDHTWKYVNKNGGPDRRFNNNTQLPICEYEEIEITSSSGVREIIQLSRTGLSKHIDSAISSMVSSIQEAAKAESERQSQEVTESQKQENIGKQVVESDYPQAPEQSDALSVEESEPVHEALFDVLFCVMMADGKASESEELKIAQIMSKSKPPWSREVVDSRLTSFFSDLEEFGYEEMSSKTMNNLSYFKTKARRSALFKCLRLLTEADGELSEKEKKMIMEINQKLES